MARSRVTRNGSNRRTRWLMTVTEWMQFLLLGGLLGAIGQGIRVISGLKKLHDAAEAAGRPMSEVFETSTLVVSLLIGFVAGALAIVGLSDIEPGFELKRSTITMLLGVGYAGTDFIEAFMRKSVPDSRRNGAPPAPEPPAVG